MDDPQTGRRPIPYLSLCGAIGFAVSLIALAIVEMTHGTDPSAAAQRTRILNVMLCMLLAAWSSIVSLITAWCPIVLRGDRRPFLWVVPLLLGWILFVQLFDWTSLVPNQG